MTKNKIVVARGDLGVECAPEDVPILQKTIIDECRNQGKPVVGKCVTPPILKKVCFLYTLQSK